LLRFLPITFLLMGHQHVKNLVKICELFSMGQQIIGVFLNGSTRYRCFWFGMFFYVTALPIVSESCPAHAYWLKKVKSSEHFSLLLHLQVPLKFENKMACQ
jgi:hypothetical protein